MGLCLYCLYSCFEDDEPLTSDYLAPLMNNNERDYYDKKENKFVFSGGG